MASMTEAELTVLVDHVLKNGLSRVGGWQVDLTAVLSEEGLQAVTSLQLQKCAQAPHQAEDKEAAQVGGANRAARLLGGDQALEQI